jgi:ligand-binding sensor domain-containing protein
MWVATYTALHTYDGSTWTELMFLPGRPNDMQIAPDGALWVATSEGLLRHDGTSTQLFTTANSGLPELRVTSVAIRDDGLVAAAAEDTFNWPYDGGIALYDGSDWTTYGYGESDLPFYQTFSVEFDAAGNLWATQTNFGAVEIILPDGPSVTGDLDGDGVVSVTDLIMLLADWGCSGPDCAGDVDDDGDVDVVDLIILLGNWT